MRTFSDFEKQIIKVLIEEKGPYYQYNGESYIANSLGRIMVEQLGVVHLKLLSNDNNFTIKIVFREDDSSGNRLNNLYEFIFLVKYLEDNYLLGLSPIGNKSNEFTSHRYTLIPLQEIAEKIGAKYARKEKDSESTRWHEIIEVQDGKTYGAIATQRISTETSLAEDILKYAYSMYYSTQQLRYIVAHDFKSFEWQNIEKQTKNSRKNVRIATIALLVAIITLLCSIIFNYCSISTLQPTRMTIENADSSSNSIYL